LNLNTIQIPDSSRILNGLSYKRVFSLANISKGCGFGWKREKKYKIGKEKHV
jgi:hypothetical protein